MRVVLLGALMLAIGCGAQVVFQDDERGEGGAGGAGPDYECILGSCGEACVKCVGDECYDGQCSEDGRCETIALECGQ